MPVTDRDAVALRPFANVLAIAAAKLIPLAVDVVDDVALFLILLPRPRQRALLEFQPE